MPLEVPPPPMLMATYTSFAIIVHFLCSLLGWIFSFLSLYFPLLFIYLMVFKKKKITLSSLTHKWKQSPAGLKMLLRLQPQPLCFSVNLCTVWTAILKLWLHLDVFIRLYNTHMNKLKLKKLALDRLSWLMSFCLHPICLHHLLLPPWSPF